MHFFLFSTVQLGIISAKISGDMKTYLLLLLGLTSTTVLFSLNSQVQAITEQEMIARGKEGYMNRCSGCHGEKADGQGPGSAMLNPKPRNLVEGSFKFRTTPSGNLPTVTDLLRTINQGIPGTAMPPFQEVSDSEKMAIITFIRSLRPDFKEARPEKLVITIPEPPQAIFSNKAALIAAAKKGKVHFTSACVSCHGDTGIGNGPSAETLVDSYEQPIKPANLTKPFIKSGKTAKDVFKAITTGLDGSPMPAFQDIFDEAKRWELVAYVFYLRGQASGIYSEKDTLQ